MHLLRKPTKRFNNFHQWNFEKKRMLYMPNFYQQIDVDMLLMSDNNIKFNILNTKPVKVKITLKPFRSISNSTKTVSEYT